jgi:cobalamin biosynthesis protein CobT
VSGKRSPPIRLPEPTTAYDRTLVEIAPQIDLLTRHIEEALRPRKRLREGRDFPSGHKLNLRRVMAYQADPRLYNKLWLRKTIPDRRSAAVSLLVDLSGSMRGEKCAAAVAGTMLVAEALNRLSIPFAINGFQDVLIPFCDFADGWTPSIRAGIAEMPQEVDGSRTSGNNTPLYNDDGPCLVEAAEGLLERSETDRVLLVVSDGIPEGRRSDENDLHKAVAQLRGMRPALTLIGLGLGSGTEHVNKYYPESIANIPAERFAEEIGRVLQRTLLGRSI